MCYILSVKTRQMEYRSQDLRNIPLFLPVLKLEKSPARRRRGRQQLHRAGSARRLGSGGLGSPFFVALRVAGLPVLLLEEIPSGQFA